MKRKNKTVDASVGFFKNGADHDDVNNDTKAVVAKKTQKRKKNSTARLNYVLHQYLARKK